MIKIIIAWFLILISPWSQAALSPEYETIRRYERLKTIAEKIESSNTKGLFIVKAADYSLIREDHCSNVYSAAIKVSPIVENRIIWDEVFNIDYRFSEQICSGPFLEKAKRVERDTMYTMNLNCDSGKSCKPASDSHFTFTSIEVNKLREDIRLKMKEFTIDPGRHSQERIAFFEKLKIEIPDSRYDEYNMISERSLAGEPLFEFIHAFYLECGIYGPKDFSRALIFYSKAAKKDFKPAIIRLSAKDFYPCELE